MLPTLPVDLFIASAWGLAGVVLTVAAVRWRQQQARHVRILALRPGANLPVRGVALWPRVRLALAALGQLGSRRSSARFERLALLIDGTGLAGRIGPAEILGWKLVLAAGGLLSALVVCLSNRSVGAVLVPILVVGGWWAPTLWLQHCRRAHLAQILRSLPTVLDLLALSLDAGMGLDRALGIICDRAPSPLSDELRRVLSAIALGVSRQEAFTRLSIRIPNEDVRLLSSSITQSEQLGSSLVSTVKHQARLLRRTRQRRAETQALRAPVKMLFPMVMFILPTLFLIVLGPPALNLTRSLAQGHP